MTRMTRTVRPSILSVGAVSALLLVGVGCQRGSDTDGVPAGDSIPSITDVDSLPSPEEPASTDAPDSPADVVADDTVVFVWTETGGCAQGGPNCARYEVGADGTVSTFREGADAAEPEVTGQVDVDLVAAWRAAVASEDIDALRARVGEGEMTAAFDGVDFLLQDPDSGLELSSVDTAFTLGEPFFEAALDLATAASNAAPLEFEMR